MAKELDAEFIRWSLDARNGIQAAILNLAACYKLPELKAAKNAAKFCELSGVAFSLWRAAFLASMATRPQIHQPEIDAKPDSQAAHASDLLRTILASNAVGFGDDRRTEYWMGQYYIDNAGYRVWNYLAEWHPGDTTPPYARTFISFWKDEVVPADYVASARAWMVIFEPFSGLVTELMESMKVEPLVIIVPLSPQAYKFVSRPALLGDVTLAATLQVSEN